MYEIPNSASIPEKVNAGLLDFEPVPRNLRQLAGLLLVGFGASRA